MIQEALFAAPATKTQDAMLPPETPKLVVVAERGEMPEQYIALYQAYLAKLRENKLPRVMFIVLDYGHEIMQLEKFELIRLVDKLLRSTAESDVKKAVEAMSRTLGEWRSR